MGSTCRQRRLRIPYEKGKMFIGIYCIVLAFIGYSLLGTDNNDTGRTRLMIGIFLIVVAFAIAYLAQRNYAKTQKQCEISTVAIC